MAKTEFWERDNFTNKEIKILINAEIIEYDIKAAGWSLAKEYGYIDQKKLEELEKLDKKTRNIKMGLMKRYDQQLSKKESNALAKARELFIKSNKLSVDQIVAIRRDAVFVTRRCNNRTFGHVRFIPKNIYTSYIEFNDVELYYNSSTVDVKGINDVVVSKHEKYMLDFFKKYLDLLESGKDSELKKFITNFVYKYKTKQLDQGYYREFNATSAFRLQERIENNVYVIDTIDSTCFNDVDISYNFFNYLVPLCTMLI